MLAFFTLTPTAILFLLLVATFFVACTVGIVLLVLRLSRRSSDDLGCNNDTDTENECDREENTHLHSESRFDNPDQPEPIDPEIQEAIDRLEANVQRLKAEDPEMAGIMLDRLRKADAKRQRESRKRKDTES